MIKIVKIYFLFNFDFLQVLRTKTATPPLGSASVGLTQRGDSVQSVYPATSIYRVAQGAASVAVAPQELWVENAT